MSETDSITVTTVVAVDPETAFSVFTEEIDAWWGRGPKYRWNLAGDHGLKFSALKQGGRLVEVSKQSGEVTFDVGEVLVWTPPKRLVFELGGRNGEVMEVDVRFEAHAGGTRVTVENRGFDQIPLDHPARHGMAEGAFLTLMGVWWGDLLTSLRVHVTDREEGARA
jgi:uncharacterized protein YndB with AHSA1/START domain